LDPAEPGKLLVGNSDLFSISVEGSDPGVARQGASSLADICESKYLIHISCARTTTKG
jgi:hypothetical protein